MASKSYFSHDSNARNSKKMLRMRQKLGPTQGAAAYGVYWMLVERLRDEEERRCERDYSMLAFEFHVEEDLVRSVVEDFELFDISADGSYFYSHGLDERMENLDAKSAAGKKGAEARWGNNKNGSEMAQNGKIMAEQNSANSNKIKLNKKKINKTSSFYSSSSCEESDEQQKQKILFDFFFKNWASPEEEVERFLAYNNTGNRCWAKMDATQRESALELWQQKPPKPPRFAQDFLAMWQRFYVGLQDLEAPMSLLHDALSDHLFCKTEQGMMILSITEELKDFIEQPTNLERLKQYLWPYMTSHKCKKLAYKINKR